MSVRSAETIKIKFKEITNEIKDVQNKICYDIISNAKKLDLLRQHKSLSDKAEILKWVLNDEI